jgi:hypothetical protein
MRRLPDIGIVVLALGAFGTACGGCARGNPTPVTFRINNTLQWPIFMQDEQSQAGVSIQVSSGGTWVTAPENLTCSCQSCDSICNGSGNCTCPPPAGVLRQVAPGASYERVWAGQYHVQSSVACFLGGPQDCLEAATNPSPGDEVRAEWCFANQLETTPPATSTFPGTIPQSNLECVDQTLKLPVSGVVQFTPPSATNCSKTADCTGNQLCQDGVCSTSCLPNTVPPLSSTWSASVGNPADQGFFATTSSTTRTAMTGTGTISSIQYTGGDVQISVYRNDPNLGRLTASMYITLPGGRAVPMAVGDVVTVTVIQSTDPTRPGAAGVIFAAPPLIELVIDSGLGGPVLTPADMQPFAVTTEGEPFACNPGDCGRKIHRTMTFTAGGTTLVLQPGTPQFQSIGGYRYEFVPVANYTFDYPGCDPYPVTPFVILYSPIP